jgi:hypothetical protein
VYLVDAIAKFGGVGFIAEWTNEATADKFVTGFKAHGVNEQIPAVGVVGDGCIECADAFLAGTPGCIAHYFFVAKMFEIGFLFFGYEFAENESGGLGNDAHASK